MQMVKDDRIEKLKKLNEAGVTQAKMAQDIGVQLSTLHKWLSGTSGPSAMAQKFIDEYISKATKPRSKR